ncbi:acyl-CoA dehydrogenase [Sphingomonadaceae bacterium jetA1]|jgi:acyl-CoA dehydrogenase|uniref:acyl-CoA dehydrogenase n=1 Tax=Facivitalis istanbulensis TaxID=3075838 RepID=UPI00349AD544
MHFTLSNEQAQIRDSVARMIEAVTELPRDGFSAESYARTWGVFAGLGIAGLCIEEANGGFSGAAEDIMLLACELGRAPMKTPRFETIVMAGRLLAGAASGSATGWRDGLIAGEAQIAVAFAEGDDPAGLSAPTLTAVPDGDGYRLLGEKVLVIGGGTADCLVVSAILPSGELALLMVEPSLPNVQRADYRLADTTPVADVDFRAVRVDSGALLARGDAAQTLLDDARAFAIMAQCAADVGGMAEAISLTIEHLKTRQQFGRTLAELQVLQHRVADMFIATNNARSSVYAATAALSGAPEARRSAASRCKIAIARASKAVIGEALHLHGGIGITTEYPVGHLYRRALVDDQLLGDVERHLAMLTRVDSCTDDLADAGTIGEKACAAAA